MCLKIEYLLVFRVPNNELVRNSRSLPRGSRTRIHSSSKCKPHKWRKKYIYNIVHKYNNTRILERNIILDSEWIAKSSME